MQTVRFFAKNDKDGSSSSSDSDSDAIVETKPRYKQNDRNSPRRNSNDREASNDRTQRSPRGD
jgi:hypothetical protein